MSDDGALEARREAAWERYRDSIPVRRVIHKPEPGDIRLAFEAGYNAAAIQDFGPFEALVREWRGKAQEMTDGGDLGPIGPTISITRSARREAHEHARV